MHALADAYTISLPSSFGSDISSGTTAQIGAFSPIWNIVIPVLLAVIVVGAIIGFFKSH